MKTIHKILIIAVILLVVIGVALTFMGKSTPTGEGPSYNASALSEKSL